MRLHAIWREAHRNLRTGTTRATTFALALLIATGGLALADLSTVRGLEEKADAFQRSGASVITLVAPGRIDGRVCDSLRLLPGVRAAGAVRDSGDSVRALALPGAPLQAKDVTPGFAAVLRAKSVPGAGITIPAPTARDLGLDLGDTLPLTSGIATVVGVFDYPDDGRRSGFGYAALIPGIPDSPYDECWVDGWPTITSLPAIIMTAVTPATGARDEPRPAIGQLNSRLGASFDGPRYFAERVTALAPAVAAALGLALGVVAIRLRRIQLASAMHSRVRRADLQAQLVIETAAWCLPTLAAAVAFAGITVATGGSSDHLTNMILALRTPMSAVAGALVGTLLGLALTRESHLFRYFKDR